MALTAPTWSSAQRSKRILHNYPLDIGSFTLRADENTSEVSMLSLTEEQCFSILAIRLVVRRTLVCNMLVFMKILIINAAEMC